MYIRIQRSRFHPYDIVYATYFGWNVLPTVLFQCFCFVWNMFSIFCRILCLFVFAQWQIDYYVYIYISLTLIYSFRPSGQRDDITKLSTTLCLLLAVANSPRFCNRLFSIISRNTAKVYYAASDLLIINTHLPEIVLSCAINFNCFS